MVIHNFLFEQRLIHAEHRIDVRNVNFQQAEPWELNMRVLYRALQKRVETLGEESSLEFTFTDEKFFIENADIDMAWKRWAIIDDKKVTRLFFFKEDSSKYLYQFILQGNTFKYDGIIEKIQLLHELPPDEDNPPAVPDFNSANLSALSTPNFNELPGKVFTDGKLPNPTNYHFYFLKNSSEEQPRCNELYQYLWENNTLRCRPNGITTEALYIVDAPVDLDWTRWSMHYDSNHYFLAMEHYYFIAFKQNSDFKELYYGRYEDKRRSYPVNKTASLNGTPPGDVNYDSFDMGFDGIDNYMYFMGKEPE